MKRNQNYEIDYINSKIIVTKSFLKEAGTVGSPAYIELVQVRRDYPNFQIVQREITKKPGKKTYGKLTYKMMEQFIQDMEEENAPAILAEFEAAKALSKAYNGSYGFVKRWFLTRYKDEFKAESEEENVA